MTARPDIAVVGAGPAGMAAAVAAAEAGAHVMVFDEQPGPGGQIYRAIETPGPAGDAVLGADYAAGRGLSRAFRDSGAEYLPGATVWQVSPDREVGGSVDGRARIIKAGAVIVAGGALERPFPIPGWTLPGVMTAGAAQIALKASGLAAADAVFAGTGPLLYLIVDQYLKAGVPVRAVLETTPWSAYLGALPRLPGALLRAGKLRQGLGYIRAIRDAGVPVIRGVSGRAVAGDGRAERVAYTHGGHRHEIAAEHVFVHQGVVPNVNLTRSIGCRHDWDPAQACWRVATDAWGATDVAGSFAAGDGAHVGGAEAARLGGQLAALGALCTIGRIDAAVRNNRGAPIQHALAWELRPRPFLDALYRPAAADRVPAGDDVVVCRCEEVTAGEVRATAALGCLGPNQLKSFCRAGMGPCQGRLCALTVTELLAEATGRPPDAVGDFRRRPPVKPLRLAELAALEPDDTDGGDAGP